MQTTHIILCGRCLLDRQTEDLKKKPDYLSHTHKKGYRVSYAFEYLILYKNAVLLELWPSSENSRTFFNGGRRGLWARHAADAQLTQLSHVRSVEPRRCVQSFREKIRVGFILVFE